MTISMYQASVPRLVNSLNNLINILDKAQAHVDAKKIDPAALIDFRLYPDMLSFRRQVQIASDTAKGVMARLAGVEVPRHEDTEQTFDDLKARIAKTIDFLAGLKREQFDGAAERDIHIKAGPRELDFKGAAFLETWAKPNFFFHLTTAYAILRHNGIELGKPDFLAGGQ